MGSPGSGAPRNEKSKAQLRRCSVLSHGWPEGTDAAKVRAVFPMMVDAMVSKVDEQDLSHRISLGRSGGGGLASRLLEASHVPFSVGRLGRRWGGASESTGSYLA